MIRVIQQDNGICVVQPGAERLTAVNASAFKTEVCDLVDAGQGTLIIDFDEVSFMDSSALGALVGILKKVGNRGEVTVCSLSGSVEQMFKITRMDRVFTAYPNLKTALQIVGQRL